MQLPRAILFDLGGTILRQVSFQPGAWAAALPRYTDPPAELDEAKTAGRIRQIVREFSQPGKAGIVEVRMSACLRHLHERLGLQLAHSEEEIELAFWRATSIMKPEPGIRPLLELLSARQIRMGIISNSMFTASVLRWELQQHALADFFPLVMASADYGLRKPHLSMFFTAIASFGLTPPEVWFVGDSLPNDILGARETGMPAIWYNPSQVPLPPEAPQPAQVIHRWEDLRSLMANEKI